uniref:glutathione transferase n=1 Tax=Pavo cristatus TaxID=9049 RepID=A0A8C9FVL4_PAVCR
MRTNYYIHLTYCFRGRPQMGTSWWPAAAAPVLNILSVKLLRYILEISPNGSLLFQQVPMVEIDGMKMVQTRAILNYIAGKYNLYGKDLKERALIDMYVEGLADLFELIMHHEFKPPNEMEKDLANIMDKATNRYFPVFEKVRGKDLVA